MTNNEIRQEWETFLDEYKEYLLDNIKSCQ
jgi:hypothetical protein